MVDYLFIFYLYLFMLFDHTNNMYIFRYRGYCPTAKLDFGQTYGNHTCRYFQDYRNTVLNSSSSNYSSGGSFPTYYTHNPDLVLSCRTRNQDRFRLSPNYQLSNLDHDRNEQLNSLHSVSTMLRIVIIDFIDTFSCMF